MSDTPNKEDERLQNSISRLLGDYRAWINCVPNDDQAKDSIETRDAIMRLTKQIALDARIDELKKAKAASQDADLVLDAWLDTSIALMESNLATLNQERNKD